MEKYLTKTWVGTLLGMIILATGALSRAEPQPDSQGVNGGQVTPAEE